VAVEPNFQDDQGPNQSHDMPHQLAPRMSAPSKSDCKLSEEPHVRQPVQRSVTTPEDDSVFGNLLHIVAVQHDRAGALVHSNAETGFFLWPAFLT
jgi:hypothetical protein